MAENRLTSSSRYVLALVVTVVFLAMIVYGAFVRSIEVTRVGPDSTEKKAMLRGHKILSKATAEVLIRQDGRMVEKVAVAPASVESRCPT